MFIDDTIVAISSAVGPAARMIVRVSGPASLPILQKLGDEISIKSGAYFIRLNYPAAPSRENQSLQVPCWVYVFNAPRSYTGQDGFELHLPGNPLLAKMYVSHLISLGARAAEPGEFTSRAFLTGRLDLTEAEGVAATIAASNDAQLRASRQLLAGELSRRLSPIMQKLIQSLALVEAGIDFTEEDISFIQIDQLRQNITEINIQLNELLAQSTRFERIIHQPTFALIGKPNSGKSTLLNALTGLDRAVVSPIAGTTRDIISGSIQLKHGIATLIDVAGIEAVGHDPHGINRQMQERSRRAAEESDYLIELIDATHPNDRIILSRKPDLVVINKSDLKSEISNLKSQISNCTSILISAKNKTGLDQLKTQMDHLAFAKQTSGTSLTLNLRHVKAIEETLVNLGQAFEVIETPELVAAELRHALDLLGQILGQVTPDDVLGHIFGQFCIGK